MHELRPYQQAAHDKAWEWMRKTTLPFVIDAVTACGKSHILAALAHTVHTATGKSVLALAPSAELVQQNAAKYRLTGNPASIYSASAGEKSMRHSVVFATPLTVKNSISKFDEKIGLIAIDEGDQLTPTVKGIIEHIKTKNPLVRVGALTATPYRLNEGYIYAMRPDDRAVPETEALNPYFAKCVYRVTGPELVDQGYLTRPVIGGIYAEQYHTKHMKVDAKGQFDKAEIDRAYHGHGRKTAQIVADVVAQSRDRMGVLIYAATLKHAEEVMASLPPELSAMVSGATPDKERADILARFGRQKIKYLVNRDVLTVGVDFPHADVIALLRATESPRLLQQIIGRGIRVYGNSANLPTAQERLDAIASSAKPNCLILDYAENLERHCPDGDIWNPVIRTKKAKVGGGVLDVHCPTCSYVNQFAARQNNEGFQCTPEGYFADLDGNPIPTDWGYMPSHYGRRCQSRVLVAGELKQCGQRWTSKECAECGADNDIAARYCEACKAEIVDPNEKLRIEFKAIKRDPTIQQTDAVVSWKVSPTITQSGRDAFRIEVETPYRSFTYWVMKKPKNEWEMRYLAQLESLKGSKPHTITYRKDPKTGFYKVPAFNRPADVAPDAAQGKLWRAA